MDIEEKRVRGHIDWNSYERERLRFYFELQKSCHHSCIEKKQEALEVIQTGTMANPSALEKFK